MKREIVFIQYITSEVYKMLVLREKRDRGEEVFLDNYAKTLFVEINGACYWSDYLKENKSYSAITSIIAYLSENEVDYTYYRREIFKMLGLLNKISDDLDGDCYVGTV